MIQKTAFILLLSCTGVGYFIVEPKIGDFLPFINSEFQQVVKKKNIPKPKSFYSKRITFEDFTGVTSEQFSFFSVLNDTSLSKMVGLNGEIINKYDSSPSSAKKDQSSQQNSQQKPSAVSLIQIEKASSKIAIPPIPHSTLTKAEVETEQKSEDRIGRSIGGMPTNPALDNTGSSGTVVVSKSAIREGDEPRKTAVQPLVGTVSYVVQVSAFQRWQHAQTLKTNLERKGYASFIGKTELPDNRGTLYRVYIGRYFDLAGAEVAAARFFKEENRQVMVIRQTG